MEQQLRADVSELDLNDSRGSLAHAAAAHAAPDLFARPLALQIPLVVQHAAEHETPLFPVPLFPVHEVLDLGLYWTNSEVVGAFGICLVKSRVLLGADPEEFGCLGQTLMTRGAGKIDLEGVLVERSIQGATEGFGCEKKRRLKYKKAFLA